MRSYRIGGEKSKRAKGGIWVKKLLLVAPLLLMLGACGYQTTIKATGQVVAIENSSDELELHIAYTLASGKYGVASYQCDNSQQCGQFKVGDKIEVYYNQEWGIQEVSK